MTIQYKSAAFDLITTNLTTVLTISTSAVAIVKTVQASHQDASNVDADLYLKKSGGSDTEIGHAQLNKSMANMIVNTLNLEAGDVIKMQADTANEVTGVVSYALIDRSQQNG
jgi:UDP-N-acetylenolpyruvoylglucosamine reductase|tara:strand:- start:107 stop:442 length:336 start_codon:yes stop_codon:yes gene_type:complete